MMTALNPTPNPPADGYVLRHEVVAFLARVHSLYIDGHWRPALSGQQFETRDPANDQLLALVARGGAADVEQAVSAARRAFEQGPWPAMRPAERQSLLLRLADLVERDAAILAELETLDNGKPLSEARGSVTDTVAYLRYMAGWATKIDGRTTNSSAAGLPFTFTRREPAGVVGAIIPWNFPLSMAAWKLAPVLATGCTIVLKPAEQTPLSALYLAGLIEEAGYPAGVVNVVTGMGDEVGAAMARHPGFDKLAFTGSTRVGRSIAAAAATNIVRVTLELGGKSPMLVLPDCDVQKAAVGAAGAIFYNQGQICCAGSRILVHRTIYDRVVSEIARIANAIRLAPGLDPQCDMGPLISARQKDTVEGFVAHGLSEGAALAAGGACEQRSGHFVRPTVLADTTNDMKVVREEIFGPVLVAAPFDDLDQAVQMANDSPYGLGASIWSNDLGAVHSLIPRLRAGNVWVNTHNLVDPSLPFGGMKSSGYGRELGPDQLEAYLETKSVWIAA